MAIHQVALDDAHRVATRRATLRYVNVRLAVVESRLLELAAERVEADDSQARARQASADHRARAEALQEDAASAGIVLPDTVLASRYGLSAFDLEVLWMAAAPRLDPSLRSLVARANDNLLHQFIDGALCLRALCERRSQRLVAQSAFESDSALLRAGLVRFESRDLAPSFRLHDELVVPGHILAMLRGERRTSPELDDLVDRITPSELLDDIVHDAEQLHTLHSLMAGFYGFAHPDLPGFGLGGMAHARGAAVMLSGPVGSGRTIALKAMTRDLGLDMLVIDGGMLAQTSLRLAQRTCELLCHEAEVHREVVVVRNAGHVLERGHQGIVALFARAIARRRALVVFCVEEDLELTPTLDDVVVLRTSWSPAVADVEPGRVWRANLPSHIETPDDESLAALESRVRLTQGQVRKAARLAYLGASTTFEDAATQVADVARIEHCARAQLYSGLGGLVSRMDPRRSLADLILPNEQLEQVRQVLAAARNRDLVLRRWGLGSVITRGKGICCLFDGDPGTGKTLCAEVLARELGLQLLRVNIASIVDKYIGETEKHLTMLFERSRPDISMLLFDEADSLFSKRTEVKQSTDRYSNMDVNVLLQLIEDFDGLVALTTNLKKSIDKAFERRITFKINFPLPEEEQRVEIWKRLMPPRIPTAEPVDYDRLATVEIAGGGIKNAVLRAGYRAAHEGTMITMDHLFDAAVHEAAAEGRLVRTDDYSW